MAAQIVPNNLTPDMPKQHAQNLGLLLQFSKFTLPKATRRAACCISAQLASSLLRFWPFLWVSGAAGALGSAAQHPDWHRITSLHLPNESLTATEESILHKICYFSPHKKPKPVIPLFWGSACFPPLPNRHLKF